MTGRHPKVSYNARASTSTHNLSTSSRNPSIAIRRRNIEMFGSLGQQPSESCSGYAGTVHQRHPIPPLSQQVLNRVQKCCPVRKECNYREKLQSQPRGAPHDTNVPLGLKFNGPTPFADPMSQYHSNRVCPVILGRSGSCSPLEHSNLS